jgi:hypothetical protein
VDDIQSSSNILSILKLVEIQVLPKRRTMLSLHFKLNFIFWSKVDGAQTKG